MEKNHNLSALLIILLVLVIAVGGYIYKGGKLPGLPSRETAAAPKILAQAEPGKILPEVAPGLIITKDATIKDSIKYNPPGVNDLEITASRYTTKATVADLYASYVDYFNENGYKITRSGTQTGVAIVVGDKASTTLSVSIYPISSEVKEVRIETWRAVIQ